MEGYDYDAASSTINIDDITTDRVNRKILRRIKENDPIMNLRVLGCERILWAGDGNNDITVLMMPATWDGWVILLAKVKM